MQPATVPAVAPPAVPLLALLRPHQWVKNLLVIPLPLLDTRDWTGAGLSRLGLVVVAFVLASSMIYVVNDIADRERDRHHPVKRLRPVASGRVSVPAAWALAAGLAVALAGVVATLPPSLTWPLLVYVPLNVAYSFRLKHIPLVDAFTVAIGFVLRMVQGYLALGEPPSGWLVLAVFSACLLVSLSRRRHDLAQVGAGHRPALSGYSISFIDQTVSLCAVLTAATVMLYLATEAPIEPYRSAGVVLLGPVAMFALFRYLQLVSVEGRGGNAVRTLLRDPLMVLSGAVWGGTLLALHIASG